MQLIFATVLGMAGVEQDTSFSSPSVCMWHFASNVISAISAGLHRRDVWRFEMCAVNRKKNRLDEFRMISVESQIVSLICCVES